MGEVQEDREAAEGAGNSGEGAGSGRGTAVSLPREGSREDTRVWAVEEERGESQETLQAEADPWTETRNSSAPEMSLPRWVWDSPARNRQPAPVGIRDLEEAYRERWAGCWAERKQRVPR